MEPEVIYEDQNFVALFKPAGLLVHPVPSAASPKAPTLTDWLLAHYPEVREVGDKPEVRPGIVHRLDRETSGLMLVPRTQEYFLYLKNLFQEHAVRKTYLALVFGRVEPPTGTIDRPIGIKSGSVKRSLHSAKMRKDAVTEYETLKNFEREDKEYSLLEVHPRTGRTHQIRVHLAGLGYPLVGDRLYGPRKQPVWAKRLMLHALSLEFSPEPGRKLKLASDPPPEFEV